MLQLPLCFENASATGEGVVPGVPLLDHVLLDVLHLLPLPEGGQLQGEPEKVSLAGPQPLERPENGQKGEGSQNFLVPKKRFFVCF